MQGGNIMIKNLLWKDLVVGEILFGFILGRLSLPQPERRGDRRSEVNYCLR